MQRESGDKGTPNADQIKINSQPTEITHSIISSQTENKTKADIYIAWVPWAALKRRISEID